MEEEIKKRIKAFIRSKDGSVKRFEEKYGLSNGALNNARYKVPDMIETVKSIYPDMNTKWIMFGDDKDGVSGSPYFDNFSIEGGAASGFGDESAIKPTGYMNIPGVSTSGGTFFIKVRGESMLNRNDPQRSIPDGSWVALRKVTTSSIQWGEVYAFMTTDGPIVKRIMPSDKEGYVRCVSFNEQEGYAPFDLPVREIIGGDFFMVTAVVNINIL